MRRGQRLYPTRWLSGCGFALLSVGSIPASAKKFFAKNLSFYLLLSLYFFLFLCACSLRVIASHAGQIGARGQSVTCGSEAENKEDDEEDRAYRVPVHDDEDYLPTRNGTTKR